MKDLSIRYVFDRIRQASETRKGLLQIEVRLNKTSRKTFISTGIHLYSNQFTDKNGFTCKNHPNAVALTGKARKIFNKIESFCLSDDCPDFFSVKNWDKEPDKIHSVIEFIKSELKRDNPSEAVWEYHHSLIRRLEEFGRIRVFSDLTYENIVDFDAHLRLTIKSQPTLYKRHSALHRYIKEAVNRGICKYNPYLQFKVKKGKSKEPTFLLEEEIKKMKNWRPTNEKLEHTKDLFIFQCYTGMAYVDMAHFSKNHIFEIEQKKVIRSSHYVLYSIHLMSISCYKDKICLTASTCSLYFRGLPSFSLLMFKSFHFIAGYLL